MNEEYDPGDNEERVLEVLKGGRATPKHIKEWTGLNDQQVNYALNRLRAAGWVSKVTTGLYELVDDPRESDGGEPQPVLRIPERHPRLWPTETKAKICEAGLEIFSEAEHPELVRRLAELKSVYEERAAGN